MKSSLKEQFARLGPIRELDRVRSGSPAVLSLRPGPDRENVKTVNAAIALARRGITLLKAKRVMEEMLSRGRAVVLLPTVEDKSALAGDLADSGVKIATVASEKVDVRAIRERLGLTQEQFALRYGLDIDAVQNWESDRRQMSSITRNYLRVIEHVPEAASEALEVPVGLRF